MAESIGPVIAIKGEAEFKAAIAGINNEFKLLGSEMKLAVSQFDKNDKSTEALTAQNKVLGKEIDAAKGKISLLTTQYDKQNSGLATLKTKLDATKAAFAADSAEVAKAQSAYDKQNNAVRTLQTDLNKAETGLNNMDKALKSNNQLLDEGAKKHTVFGAASEKLGLNLGNLKTAFGAVGLAVGTYLVGAIGKAGEVEASTSRLTKLLENQGISADEAGQDIKSFTSAITSMSTFSGGDAREALQVLTEKGMEAGNALKNAGLLADIAAGQNTSLASAADLLANAYNGKTKALTTLGILSKEEVKQLGDTEDATITMDDVQQRLNDRFGGSAQADRATVNGQMKVMENQMASAKTTIGTALLPILAQLAQKLAEIVIPIVNFIKENPNFTVAILGITAALGTLVGGALVVSTMIGVMGTAIGGAGLTIGALVLPVLAVVAGIGLLVAGGVLLYKHFSAEAIPAVQLFGSETSKATQAAVQGYLDLDTKATQSLMSLNFSGKAVSKETADALTKNFDDMGTQIKAGMDKHYGESFTTMQDFFAKSTVLTATEEAAALAAMTLDNTTKKLNIDEGEKQISAILLAASIAKRALTTDEQVAINTIQEAMKTNAVTALSDTELESKLILERMKLQAGELTAQQAAEVAKNSIAQKDLAVQAANDQYDLTVKAIIKQRDETGTISADQAAKLIADAGIQRDGAVTAATDMNNEVVDQAKLQAKDHVAQIDWTTGEVKSKWQAMVDTNKAQNEEIRQNMSNKWAEIKTQFSSDMDNIGTKSGDKWGSIKQQFTDDMANIKNTVNNIDLHFPEIQIPDIKTPHFNFTGSFSLNPPSVPHFDPVEWYDQGAVFTRPSVIGVGEKRPEFVGALDDLKYIVRNEIERSGKGQGAIAGGDINITMPGMVIREEADIKKISRGLYNLLQQTSRGRGV